MGRGLCLSILLSSLILGCSQPTSTVTTSNRSGATANGPTPVAYCTTTFTYTPNISVTGTAEYQVRPLGATGLGTATQSLLPANTYPIRFAEVRITNASGTLVACSETDVNGNFTFALPTGSATYTISVNSRAKNSNEEISVFDAPETNRFYSLTWTFDPTVDTTPTAVAPATVDSNNQILGGAFNILDKIILANEFLRTKTSGCNVSLTGCVPVTSTHKVDVYWTAGFNPGSYYNSGPVSFYLPGYYRLFILGGLNGDVDHTDTDHFDNSVILHEYGHFLEDTEFASDSPGGSHSGNAVIDPRLAWSEGWGNFFQSAVLIWAGLQTAPTYQDSFGNEDDGSGYYTFNIDLEDSTASQSHDYPDYAGEGIFREFSVARLLSDVVDTTVETGDTVGDNFSTLWAALTKNTDFGFNNSNSAFRNAGQMHSAQAYLVTNNGADSWSNVRTLEKHTSDTSEYAQYVTTGTCADYSINPTFITGDSGAFSTSHLLLNNDFYHLKITTRATYTITLEYEDANGVGTEADLDLYLYNSNARFGYSSDMVKYSRAETDANSATPQTETITKTLSPGDYLINVNVYTGGSLGGAVNYRLKLGSLTLCPTSLPN